MTQLVLRNMHEALSTLVTNSDYVPSNAAVIVLNSFQAVILTH